MMMLDDTTGPAAPPSASTNPVRRLMRVQHASAGLVWPGRSLSALICPTRAAKSAAAHLTPKHAGSFGVVFRSQIRWVQYGKKTPGEPGHTRDTRAHTGTRITETNLTTLHHPWHHLVVAPLLTLASCSTRRARHDDRCWCASTFYGSRPSRNDAARVIS
mgnify:CR=1 FL=1